MGWHKENLKGGPGTGEGYSTRAKLARRVRLGVWTAVQSIHCAKQPGPPACPGLPMHTEVKAK